MLIAKKLIQCLKLIELQHTVILQIGSHEDVVYVLHFLCLQLVSRVDHKLGKVVQLNSLTV